MSKQFGDKFCNKPLNKIYVLEVFAGSARLSKAALEQGFASIAIDHKSDRSCGISIQHYDLTDPSQVESLLVFIRENKDDIAMVLDGSSMRDCKQGPRKAFEALREAGDESPSTSSFKGTT